MGIDIEVRSKGIQAISGLVQRPAASQTKGGAGSVPIAPGELAGNFCVGHPSGVHAVAKVILLGSEAALPHDDVLALSRFSEWSADWICPAKSTKTQSPSLSTGPGAGMSRG
ncbi:hypothetical protein [Frankia sp. R82]|uniref:hypothetical protein n=1 Tax=Frankia sp. R82 TaxID=2950553 RepID=UPI002043C63F|nr:hypothetical protein [Frankia sp. R82]MCM3884302.1 hypothetical protein [Frankia sp. R82]